MWKPGPLELGIILVIVLLVFGVGRIGKISGELGSAIRQFREGLTGGEKDKKDEAQPEPNAEEKKDVLPPPQP
jgi:sec-independent protein translocase protein TatA